MTTKYERPIVNELKKEQYETDVTARELEQLINHSPVRRYLPLITRAGNFRGEIKYLTKAQYRKYLRKEPKSAIVDNSGRIPWHYAFDEIASESGFKSDEDFKEAIEKLAEQKRELSKLRQHKMLLRQDIGKAEKAKPSKKVLSLRNNAPVFPKSETTKSIVMQVNGLEMTAKRNPSFYQIQDNKPETPHVRVRYASEARKLMSKAADYHIEDVTRRKIKLTHRTARTSRRTPRISTPSPRLR